jgi:hypothetical protein
LVKPADRNVCHFDRSPRFCFRRKHGGEVEKSALLVPAKAHSSWWLALEDTYAEPENLLEYKRAGVGKADLSARPRGLGRGDKKGPTILSTLLKACPERS